DLQLRDPLKSPFEDQVVLRPDGIVGTHTIAPPNPEIGLAAERRCASTGEAKPFKCALPFGSHQAPRVHREALATDILPIRAVDPNAPRAWDDDDGPLRIYYRLSFAEIRVQTGKNEYASPR